MFSRTILSCRIHELLYVPSRFNVPKYKNVKANTMTPWKISIKYRSNSMYIMIKWLLLKRPRISYLKFYPIWPLFIVFIWRSYPMSKGNLSNSRWNRLTSMHSRVPLRNRRILSCTVLCSLSSWVLLPCRIWSCSFDSLKRRQIRNL